MGAPERVARQPFSGRRVALGVSGGIAAYKTISLARDLTLAGAAVDVILTAATLDFVRPLSFEALTGRPVYSEPYASGDPLLHIRLAKEADLVVIAPATANFIARAAAGMADDLLTTVLLAARARVVVCPAMNDRMYAHPQVQANLQRLAKIGYEIIGPADGPLAWGEGSGPGRMVEPGAIFDEIARLLTPESVMTGKRVLVTAGPTREPIDPVRFIGNRSSGRMGFAVAAVARRLGAHVTLVSGPSQLPTPSGVNRIDVETAEQMLHAVEAITPASDVVVMSAAIADFRPRLVFDRKIKKEAGDLDRIDLERTADVLKSTRVARKPGAITVGFALETGDSLENGRRKLIDKDLDILIVNDATEPGAGFDVATNRVTILDRLGSSEDLPLLQKEEVAERILARVIDLLTGPTG